MAYDILNLVDANCITIDDGNKVYEKIQPDLKAGKSVILDFTGVEVFASPFFNSAIGRLLKDISTDNLNRLLEIRNLSSVGIDVLKRVIANSERYYEDEKNRNATDEILNKQSKGE